MCSVGSFSDLMKCVEIAKSMYGVGGLIVGAVTFIVALVFGGLTPYLLWSAQRSRSDVEHLKVQLDKSYAQLSKLQHEIEGLRGRRNSKVEEASVQKILARWRHDDLFRSPTIPSRKIRGAIDSAKIPTNEAIWALFDFTVFGSAKNCLVITAKGLYFSHPEVTNISWAELASATIEWAKGEDVKIGDKKLSVLNDEEGMVGLLEELKKEASGRKIAA
jgi:hypothetical protein